MSNAVERNEAPAIGAVDEVRATFDDPNAVEMILRAAGGTELEVQ